MTDTPPDGTVALRAYAKINLTLEILGQREDGYHDLVSVVQTVSLADELTVELTPGPSELQATGWPVPEGPENLCLQAAALHQESYGWSGGVRIGLTKNIPPGSGLGGGSSDAAATLAALQRLTGSPADPAELVPLAARLGSDVPLFLTGGTLVMTGRGEQVRRLPQPVGELCFVVARPSFGIVTAEAYALVEPCDWLDGGASERLCAALEQGARPSDIATLLRNSFNRPLKAAHPRLGELCGRPRAAGALGSQISGSGSACFGVFTDFAAARAAAQALRVQDLWAAVVEPVNSGYDFIAGGGER